MITWTDIALVVAIYAYVFYRIWLELRKPVPIKTHPIKTHPTTMSSDQKFALKRKELQKLVQRYKFMVWLRGGMRSPGG
jgi:hypothetical protein